MSLFNFLSAALIVLILAACVVLVTGLQAARADAATVPVQTALHEGPGTRAL